VFSNEVNHQQLHHFLYQSPWDAEDVMDAVAHSFVDLVEAQGLKDSLNLIIDESAFSKKGQHSAGVTRQYNGNRGKIDNCQVGVFGALNAEGLTSLVQAKLYNPASGQTKIDLARKIIMHQVKDLGIDIQYVCMDAFYGRDSSLLATLKDQSIHFIADVPENLCMCLEPFQLRLPKSEGRGRKPTRRVPNKPFVRIDAYAKSLKKSDFQQLNFRYGSGKKLKAKFHCTTVYIQHPQKGTRMELKLLIRKDLDGTIKYSLCHPRPNDTIKDLAYHQSTRFFIEHAFRNNKQHLKMNQYQTRSEKAWTKHMALCMLAMLFVTKDQITCYLKEKIYLSAQDITRIIISVILFADERIKQNIDEIWLKANKDKRLARNKFYIRT
jgi:SRSO17 transposase